MASIAFITGAYAQNVNIPDANFKAALVANASINTNMDTEIQVIEASVFNGAINVSQLNITDLTGIEEFVALDYLDCRGNYISGLDVSANIALTYLDCSGNYLGFDGGNDYVYYLDTLDVSANIAITILKCNNNGLLSLNTTGLTALTYIDCSFNSRLYIAESPKAATVLYHSSSPLLNFSSNTALTYLNCSSNALSSLDVSENTALTYLDCSNYNWSEDGIMVEDGVTLSSLNLSANTELTYLNCIGNVLSSLDVSTCTALTFLDCSYNQLTSLDVSANTELTYLNCIGNVLSSLDVSTCTALTFLDCSYNQLTSLDVSACTALTTLNCSGSQFANQLTSLNLSANTALTYLNCTGNVLSSLDVSTCTALTYLNCAGNQLTSLDVKNGNNINMVTFSAFVNPNLSCIEVDDVAWSNSNWANNINATASFSLNCSGAGISDINESNAPMFCPNPTTCTLFITEKVDITLTDLSGKLLLEQKKTNQLDISALPAGIYFLHFGENTKQTFKVIKE